MTATRSTSTLLRLAAASLVFGLPGCGANPEDRDISELPQSGGGKQDGFGGDVGSEGDDTLHGGEAADVLEGRGGSDRLFGGGGPDDLMGGDQGDMLQGGPGDDLLAGEHGPDLLSGGEGDDELRGGSGSDYYVIEAGHGHDVIEDSEGTHDRLTLAGLSPDDVVSAREGDDLLITVPDGSVRIVDHFGAGAIELIDHEWGQDPFTSLDYGIYWFGRGNDRIKHVPTVANPYFDPSRPTILLVHGLQPGSIPARRRPGLNYGQDTVAPDRDLADAWIDQGWNIGVFYWQGFADEEEVMHGEAKVWSPRGLDGLGMRWRTQDGSYHEWPFDFSVGDLATGSMVAALLEAQVPTVRVAGHSLGNQVATVVAAGLQERVDTGEVSSRMRPERLGLLDPFWSKGAKDYLGGSEGTGARAYSLVRGLLDAGVPVDSYRSSGVTSTPLAGDSNEALFRSVCLVELRPHFLEPLQIAEKHMVGYWHYVMGFEFPDMQDELGNQVATAAAPTSVLWDCIDGDHHWNQLDGRLTMTPEDDGYERVADE